MQGVTSACCSNGEREAERQLAAYLNASQRRLLRVYK
jgi:hypothetical protein